jgi:hypothetical protein
MAQALGRFIGAEAQPRRPQWAARGRQVAIRCLPQNVLPRWQSYRTH